MGRSDGKPGRLPKVNPRWPPINAAVRGARIVVDPGAGWIGIGSQDRQNGD